MSGQRSASVTARVAIHFSALAPRIEEQLRSQGLTLPEVEAFQHAADAVTTLYLFDFIGEAQAGKIRERIFRRIEGEVQSE